MRPYIRCGTEGQNFLFLCCASVYPTWCGGTNFFCFCVALNRRGQPQSSHTPHHTTPQVRVESRVTPSTPAFPPPNDAHVGPAPLPRYTVKCMFLPPPPLPVRCPNGRSRSNGVCTPHPCNPCASRHPHGFFKPAASRRVRERASPRHAGHLTTLVSFQAARAGEQANSLSSICVFFLRGRR